MGSTSSVLDQKQLYDEIKSCLDGKDNEREDSLENDLLMTVNEAYQNWLYKQYMKSSVVTVNLVEFESPLENIFQSGLTPFIIDQSPDRKVVTFFSYQHTEIIDGKRLVTDYLIRKRPLKECLNYCRLLLVNAMKHGKLLVIHLGESAPDFMNVFNDGYLKNIGQLENPDESYFPIDALYEGGSRMKNNEWVKRLFREEDMLPHKNFAICRYVTVTSSSPSFPLFI